MPPKVRFTKNEMISAALDIVRRGGADALTARSLAAELGCSVKPIFGLFSNMDELHAEVIKGAGHEFSAFMERYIKASDYPAYKAAGMSYIQFAKDETHLFRLLFMRDRSEESHDTGSEDLAPLIAMAQEASGLDEKRAYMFHLELWIYIHGIASMFATSYLELDTDFAEKSLTDVFTGLRYRFCGEETR